MLDQQLAALRAAGCERVLEDRAPEAGAGRLGLAACLERRRAGDVLVVLDLDPLAALIDGFEGRGMGFRALNSPMETTTPAGRAFLQIEADFADMERDVSADGCARGCAPPARGAAGAAGPARWPPTSCATPATCRPISRARSPPSRLNSAACRPSTSTPMSA